MQLEFSLKFKNNKGKIIIVEFDLVTLPDITQIPFNERTIPKSTTHHIEVLRGNSLLVSEPFETYHECERIIDNIYMAILNGYNILDLDKMKQ